MMVRILRKFAEEAADRVISTRKSAGFPWFHGTWIARKFQAEIA
jgi:hypothetical protein